MPSHWDEGENATGRRFHPRSNENRELKDGAMLLRATTIFSEGHAPRPKCAPNYTATRCNEVSKKGIPKDAQVCVEIEDIHLTCTFGYANIANFSIAEYPLPS